MEQNKINGQLYRQVFVRSESDLPKEEGNYLSFRRSPNEITNIHIFPDNKESRKRWMNEIDWYLQPIEPREPEQRRDYSFTKEAYRLNCDSCGMPYWSKEAFPIDQSCEKCKFMPKFDEQYLNDCIKKATPGLSKIKDVDKHLDEIRGRELKDDYIPKPFKFCPGCGKDWEEDSGQFGCWSCGWSKHKITMINKK